MQKSTAVKEMNSEGVLKNSKVRDSSSKIIFDEPILCAQFVRDYVDLPYMKDVKPEDIEDVSEQFVPLFAEERNADRVKRIRVQGENPFFLVSLIEHKSDIDYNVCMQVFRYMIYIWEAFEKEEEAKQKGVSKLKGFKYPPVLPIVYYEGSKTWTAPLNFQSRINQGDVFAKYVPEFQYYLVPIHDYTNEELLARADEMSLVMLINKLQTKADIEEFGEIDKVKFTEVLQDTPERLRGILADVLLAFLLKGNVPVEEAEELAGKVREKKVGELFANMEKIDIQASRRDTAKQRERAEKAEQRAEKAEQRAEKAEQRAEVAETMADVGIQLFIENCQKYSAQKADVLSELMEKFGLSEEVAQSKLDRYWK